MGSLTQPTRSRVRILVVDDNETMRRCLRNLLESKDNWQVCAEAANGREAVEKTEQVGPDVVLLDFQMPEMDGLEAARLISQRRPSIPMLMISLHMSTPLSEQARRAGIRGTCAKTDIKCVVEAVETLLENGTYFRN